MMNGPTGAIAWHTGDLEAAFAMARARQQPLFLYWGARWCPPCNRVKAEIFARDEFQSRAAAAVCYQLDGDSAGAQAAMNSSPSSSQGRRVISPPSGAYSTSVG